MKNLLKTKLLEARDKLLPGGEFSNLRLREKLLPAREFSNLCLLVEGEARGEDRNNEFSYFNKVEKNAWQQTGKHYVYVLENPSMPNLLKIGRTSDHSVIERTKSLTNNTAVPTAFKIFTFLEVETKNQSQTIEEEMHNFYRHVRVRQQREFFTMNSLLGIGEGDKEKRESHSLVRLLMKNFLEWELRTFYFRYYNKRKMSWEEWNTGQERRTYYNKRLSAYLENPDAFIRPDGLIDPLSNPTELETVAC